MGAQHWWPAQSPIEMMLGLYLFKILIENADMALTRLKEETQFNGKRY